MSEPGTVGESGDHLPSLEHAGICAAGAGDTESLAALEAALSDPGGFVLTGAPVPDELLVRMEDTCARFFALPLADKRRYRYPADQFTGWCGGEDLSSYGSRDYKEMFHIGPRFAPTLAAHDERGDVAQPTVVTTVAARSACPLWPEEPVDFVAVWHEYYRCMQTISVDLGRALARLLGIGDARWFEVTGGNWADLAANWYPPLPEDDRSGDTVYNAAHRDLTIFTVLHQDRSPAGTLAVETADGRWIPVAASAGSLVINVGELLTFLSGGRWRAVPHRVTPAASSSGVARLSVPFFYRPSDHAVVSSFVDPQAPPVAVGAWVVERKQATSER